MLIGFSHDSDHPSCGNDEHHEGSFLGLEIRWLNKSCCQKMWYDPKFRNLSFNAITFTAAGALTFGKSLFCLVFFQHSRLSAGHSSILSVFFALFSVKLGKLLRMGLRVAGCKQSAFE